MNFIRLSANLDSITGDKSIWWNFKHNDKPLAFLQGCYWHNRGIRVLDDIMHNGILLSWKELSVKFGIPHSQSRTFKVLRDALSPILPQHLYCPSQSPPIVLGWSDSTPLPLLKAKPIYDSLLYIDCIFDYLNSSWNLVWPPQYWSNYFMRFWAGPWEPKKNFFRW